MERTFPRKLLIIIIMILLTIAPTTVVNPQPKIVLDVPYVNQVYDVPKWFDGRYSCGAACVVMVLAYYNTLTPWPCNCSKPFPHISVYGNYIACKFKVGDFDFNEKAEDASRIKYAYGIHGFIYIPWAGASWERIVKVFEIFGFKAYIDTKLTWDKFISELKEGRPVILSTDMTRSGYLIVAIGYINNGSVIVNDPASDIRLGYYNYTRKASSLRLARF